VVGVLISPVVTFSFVKDLPRAGPVDPSIMDLVVLGCLSNFGGS
jgi:hypothetical protein